MRFCPKSKEEVDEKFDCKKCIFYQSEKMFPCTFKNIVLRNKKEKDTCNNEEIGNA